MKRKPMNQPLFIKCNIYHTFAIPHFNQLSVAMIDSINIRGDVEETSLIRAT